MREFEILKRTICDDVKNLEINLQKEIDSRIFEIGRDIEVPVWSGESGNWEKASQNLLPAVYKMK